MLLGANNRSGMGVPNGTSFRLGQAYIRVTQQVTASRHLTETAQTQVDCAMNTRIASAVAAAILSVGAMASPALAQSYTAPAGIAAVAAPGSVASSRYDDITTGSIRTVRGRDSAQEGNAGQPNFPVQQYGQTSGGPAR